MKKKKWIVYRSVDQVFVTTPKCEALFREQVATWSLGAAGLTYDLDGDFEREVVTDCCVLVEATLSVRCTR